MEAQGSILLADDEDTFLEATEDLLKEEGFDCVAVKNAEELSRALKATDFDLLITDLNMPGNRVLEMVDEIRVSTLALPVIVVTGYPSIPSAVESVRLNVLEYMIKPVDFPKLLDATKRGVQHKQVLRSVKKAKHEAAQRARRLAEMEETLSAYRGLVPDGGVQDALVTDPQIKHLQLQLEGLSHSLEQDERSASFTQDSFALMADYLRLRDGLYETIQVLQKTKGSFHSKELARLRIFIQDLLRDTWAGSKNK
jgi:FixJ family two-component response regulator